MLLMTVTRVNSERMIAGYWWVIASFNFCFTKEIIYCQPPPCPVQCEER